MEIVDASALELGATLPSPQLASLMATRLDSQVSLPAEFDVLLARTDLDLPLEPSRYGEVTLNIYDFAFDGQEPPEAPPSLLLGNV